jgi:hypothetical protein
MSAMSERRFGRCLRCKEPWNIAVPHGTTYDEATGNGMFPLCEPCWTALGTPFYRLPYYRSLWEDWRWWADCDPQFKAVLPPWQSVFDAVRKETGP